LDELSGAFVEAEGEVFRRPDVQAGQWIKIEGLGKRLSGEYMVTRAMHVYTSAGLQTYFTVSGARTGLLLEQLRHEGTTQPQFGIVPAIVTNTDDPEGWGRVKVKYPWLSDQEESYWARVLSLGAGPNCGLTIIPAVDDEVMVVFQQGDFDHPVVLGGMWNGVDAVPAPISSAAAGEKPLVRSWMSRTGHHMTIYDNADNKVELVTNGGHSLTLDDAGKTITIQSAGGLEIVMDDNGQKIVVKSGGDIEVTAANGLTMKGTNVKFEASGTMDLQASGPVNVKGATINLN